MHTATQPHKTDVVTLVGANSDGRHLYLNVEVFDGEHTNRFEPVFDAKTSSREITEYMKGIIEKSPELNPEVAGMMGKKLFWDKDEKGYMTQKPQHSDGKKET